MFLIEFKKDTFIDGEKIDWVEIKNNTIQLTIMGDIDTIYTVSDDYAVIFLNHLNCLNGNISKLEININKQTDSTRRV